MRTLALATLLALTPALAQATSLQVSGKAGYLSEWEVTATANPQGTGVREFSGPLLVKHIGLCSPNGPVEKSGEIKLKMTGLSRSTIDATLTFGGQTCTLRAFRADTVEGTMDCPDTRGVPITLTIK
jgi:hypothetical protein